MQRLQISIPKPCHQDWNQMTPDERGRFCSMCKKTVLDFSEKTEGEILDFINSHRHENLCGRFRKDQLDRFSRIELPLPVYRPHMSFINAFLVALLFCFGTSLFSCTTPNTDQSSEKTYITTGAIMMTPMAMDPDSGKASEPENSQDKMTVGNLMTYDSSFSYEEKHVKGEVAAYPDTTVNLPAVDITDSTRMLTVHTLGMVAVRIEDIHDIDDSFIEETDSSAREKDVHHSEINTRNFFTSIYPNPSDGLLNVKLQLAKEQNVQMDLYDLSGRLLHNLIAGERMQPEMRTMRFDVSDQPPGIYFLRILAGDSVKTTRVIIAERK